MQIEVKNLKDFPSMSEETNAFIADIFINGKKKFTAKNDGRGGETYINGDSSAFSGSNSLYVQVDNYCKTTLNVRNFVDYVDDLVFKLLVAKDKAKAEKKFQKHCLKGIVYSKDGTINTYYTCSWNYPIEIMKQSAKGRELIEKQVKEIKEKGFIILNKNL
jgi:hypothetical protein